MKPESILELEKRYNIKLNQLEIGKDIFSSYNRHSYLLNDENEVIGLNLTESDITEISYIETFDKLIYLDLRYNSISEVILFNSFNNLININLSYNLIKDVSLTNSFKKINILKISSNIISNISIDSELEFLTDLSLSENEISNLSFLVNLKKLKYLDLSSNNIDDISDLENLKYLNVVVLNRNKIIDASCLGNLNKLTEINIWSNQLQDISFLPMIDNLLDLDLWNNIIKDFSPIQKLKSIKNLDLGRNDIRDISFLKGNKSLYNLNLTTNLIEDISVIGEIEDLRVLTLKSNKIIDFSPLAKNKKLISLNISENKKADFSFLNDLFELQSLYLSNNEIEDISFLKDLNNLKNLDLSSNNIKEISPLIDLIKTDIRITFKENDTGLNLFNNPLVYPSIQTVKRGKDAIFRFFKKIEEEGIAPIYESKVTFVGEGSAGKTSLQKRLLNPKAELPKEDKRTRGIEVIDWMFKKQKGKIHIAHIWDFGGQDVYYPVHRFFLTENSVFVLMASSRQNTHNFEYWIPTIFQFGGKSPIILGQTCHDGNRTPWNDLGIYVSNENFNIIQNNENIYHEINLKNKSNLGLVNIKKAIINEILNLPHYKKNVPKSWLQVRELIEKLKKYNCISYIEIKEKIIELNPESFSQKEDIEDSLKFFHDIGIILWYYNEDYLKDWVILNPSWSVDAVYKIIDDDKILNQKGIILNEDFERVWKDKKYEDKHSILKEMLEVFKIAFRKKHNNSDFIIPARLLSIPKENVWKDHQSELHIEYKYEFMPKGMVNQISAELSRCIVSDEEVWNNGVNLIYERSEGQIFEDFYNRKISIKSKGNDARGLNMTIMNAVKNITDEYKGVFPKIIIPCPCESCKNQNEPEKFNYENLLLKLEKNISAKVMCNNSDTVFEIEKLLYTNGLPNPVKEKIEQRNSIEMKTIKIFLASSNELKDEREKFRNFISLENDRLHKKGIYFQIIQWEYFLDEISDTRLQDEYNNELKVCDIALCLFFTKVGIFTEEEFDTAYTKFKADGNPKIWTYFKNAEIKTGTISKEINSLINFKEKLKELGHFATEYISTEDLHLKFKRQLEYYIDN